MQQTNEINFVLLVGPILMGLSTARRTGECAKTSSIKNIIQHCVYISIDHPAIRQPVDAGSNITGRMSLYDIPRCRNLHRDQFIYNPPEVGKRKKIRSTANRAYFLSYHP